MRITIVQVSDIHFADQNDNAEKLLPKIATAMPLTSSDSELILVLVTGDIAQSAAPTQYKQAKRAFEALRTNIEERFSSIQSPYIICCPGNHDCILDPEDTVRATLVANVSKVSLDSKYIEACSAVQKSFVYFRDTLPASPKPSMSTALQQSYHLSVGQRSLRVDAYNSAWMSQRTEPHGRIRMPVELLTPPTGDEDVTVAMLHHPYSWFDPELVSEFKRYIETNYDVVLTGHEHVPDAYRKSRELAHTEYLEADVFQESPHILNGGFRIIEIDLARTRYRTALLQWNKKRSVFEEQPETNAAEFVRNAARTRNQFTTQPTMLAHLIDPGESFLHPRKPTLSLEDIFVEPDCRVRRMSILPSDSSPRRRFSVDLVLEHRKLAIVAPESAGKTTLCKAMFQQLRNRGLVPVLLRGVDVVGCDQSLVSTLLEQTVLKTYSGDARAPYRAIPIERRAILIDDFDRSPATWPNRLEFLRILGTLCTVIIFTTRNDPLLDLAESLGDAAIDTSQLELFSLVHPQELGNERRYELVKKWCRIGVEYADQEASLDKNIMSRQSMLTSLISKKIISVYPLYVLLCLQQLELAEKPEIGGGSFGYLYESLLSISLAAAKSPLDLDLRHNFLAEFAEELRSSDSNHVEWSEFIDIVERYNSKYDTIATPDAIVVAAAPVIVHDSGRVRFRHRFAYYYYVARYINVNLARPMVRALVEDYADRMHNELAGNVLMFLCHLAKGGQVLDIILKRTKALLGVANPLNFKEDIAELGVATSRPLKLLGEDIDTRRQNVYTKKDEIEELEPKANEVELVSQMNAAIKCTQIIGQILRGFQGSIHAEKKRELAEGAYMLMLRMMGAWVEWAKTNRAEVIELLSELLRERSESISESDVEQEAERLLLWLVEGLATYGVLNVAESLGRAALMRTFDSILGKHAGKTGIELIHLAIRMQCAERFPTDDIVRKMRTLDSQFAKNVLRRIVARHIYLFPIAYDERQKVCVASGIEWVEPANRGRQLLLKAPPKRKPAKAKKKSVKRR